MRLVDAAGELVSIESDSTLTRTYTATSAIRIRCRHRDWTSAQTYRLK
jgi:hypothetical protein